MPNADIHSQTSGNFACLVELRQWCGPEDKGYIEFELKGDPSNYTYYWTHGPTTLAIDCLPEGTYTLVVIDQYGCVETYTVEIIRLADCSMTYELKPTLNPCVWAIEITVTDISTGNPIPESALNIEWSDGNPAGLVRLVTRNNTVDYCVSISASSSQGEPGGVTECCDLDECITVTALEKCKDKNGRQVIVNEVNRGGDSGGDFIELMIIGSGECPDSFDLQGFIVDDNNGYLIPGNDFLSGNNPEDIGIDRGYLVFADRLSWEKVPNGSLIVIHSGQSDHSGTMPAEDPEDSDGDGVYVLRADNSDYLWAKSGEWNELNKIFEYHGYLVPPTWELIQPSPKADGIQVRYPDGSFSHGVSIGETPFTGDNLFSLWLTDAVLEDYNINFSQENYLSKDHFEWAETQSNISTPGLPNSSLNSVFLSELKDCPEQTGNGFEIVTAGKQVEEEALSVSPNPFDRTLELQTYSSLSGAVSVRIFSFSGQLLFEQSTSCEKGHNRHSLETGQLPSGVLNLQYKFPSGNTVNKRIVHMDSR